MRWQLGMGTVLFASLTASGGARAESPEMRHEMQSIRVVAVDREPKEGREKPSEAKLALLRQAVIDNPDERTKRFDLARGLMATGDMRAALKEAQAWREKDAYNLVVVRLLGDIYSELGEKEEARRTYSAIVELVPKDLDAQRALATVLKQGGDLDGAYDRLVAAMRLRPDDVRTGFELADVAQRLGRSEEAAKRFEEIVQASTTPEAVRYPAKQRLAQLFASKKRDEVSRGDSAAAKTSTEEIAKLGIKGGAVNDIKIYLTWDTDKTDVDLWVTNPAGEKIFYSHKEGSHGDALFDDVTSGYGPESYTAKSAQSGTYLVQVNYFSSRRSAFNEARGEIVAILFEGTAKEERHVLPYRLFSDKQTVTVARIEVKQ